eukprot:m.107394 g.107394  ORF g.107394 m.107394 type:complete len:103 (-) comp16918_c0_seq3:171-479(-)
MGVFDSHARCSRRATLPFVHRLINVTHLTPGLVKDDHVLASAVWRNLFHHTKGTATARDVAQLVAYIRREVHALDGVDAKDLLERGAVSFGAPPAVCVESTE